jgi:hypothetical protein
VYAGTRAPDAQDIHTQERCRFLSGAIEAGKDGAKQWWRSAVLDPSGMCFEPSQRAAMAGSRYCEWHSIKAGTYAHLSGQSPYDAAEAMAMSPVAWLRQKRVCAHKCKALAGEEARVRMRQVWDAFAACVRSRICIYTYVISAFVCVLCVTRAARSFRCQRSS